MLFLAPIVEGHGEVEALPALLHRIASVTGSQGRLRVNPPIRIKSGSFHNDADYFHKQVTLATAKAAQGHGTVLILLDCEDDCPATIGPDLLQRAQAVRADINIIVALAYREYETWFVAASKSLRGLRGLPLTLEPPVAPERVRDAKNWLGQRMDGRYDSVTHQIEFTRAFDLNEARSNPSFDRLYQRILGLLEVADGT